MTTILDDKSFSELLLLIHDLTGITIAANRTSMVEGRLRKRIASLDLPDICGLNYNKRDLFLSNAPDLALYRNGFVANLDQLSPRDCLYGLVSRRFIRCGSTYPGYFVPCV